MSNDDRRTTRESIVLNIVLALLALALVIAQK